MEIDIQANIARSQLVNNYDKLQATQNALESSSSHLEQISMPSDTIETISKLKLVDYHTWRSILNCEMNWRWSNADKHEDATEGSGQDLTTSEWVQQYITKLSAEFGVDLKNCEGKV